MEGKEILTLALGVALGLIVKDLLGRVIPLPPEVLTEEEMKLLGLEE